MLPCLSRLSLTSGCAGEEAATGTHEGDLDALRAHLFQTAVLNRDPKARKNFNETPTDTLSVDDVMRMVGTLQSPGVSEGKRTKDQLGGVDGVQPWHRLRLKIEMATILLENLKRVRATTPNDGTAMTSNFYLLSAILASKQADDPTKQNERAKRTREVAQAESAAARRKLGQVPKPYDGSLPTPVILAQTAGIYQDSPGCFVDPTRNVVLRQPITLRELNQLPKEDKARYTPMYVTMDDTLLNYYLSDKGVQGLQRVPCPRTQTGAEPGGPGLKMCLYDPETEEFLPGGVDHDELVALTQKSRDRYGMMFRSMNFDDNIWTLQDEEGLVPRPCPPGREREAIN